MTDTNTTPADATTAPVDAVADTSRVTMAAPEKTLLERAEAIVENLEGVAFHDAVSILNHVAERITGGATREAAIVKTKFEEAILWVRRHFETKAVTEANAAADATPAAPAAAEEVK